MITMIKSELKSIRKALRNKQAEIEIGIANRKSLATETSPDEQDRLREVRAALRRIEEGAFGLCADCGETINPKRLAAIPWASHCIVCQKATDRERAAPARWFDASAFMAA